MSFGTGQAVTPSDSTAFAFRPRALYVGGAGDVTVKWTNGTQTTFKAVPVGTTLPICPVYVMATGTTATQLVALWGG